MTGITEAAHQATVINWAGLSVGLHPELRWLYHTGNGVALGGSIRDRAIRGKRSKQQGIKPGIPDLCLPVARGGYHGLYIELKRTELKPKRNGKGGLSVEQVEFIEFATAGGYRCDVCYGWEEAVTVLQAYLALV